MTDREFIKLNTSIQTASNSSTIQEQEDGTIPASIELRLPDSLFNAQTGNKKIDTVSMLTTKLRLSMMEAPIAQIPLDPELTNRYKTNVSTCKLDVYPWIVDDQGNLLPPPPPTDSDIAFPAFKKHKILFKFRVCTAVEPEETYQDLDDEIQITSNDPADVFYQLKSSLRFADLLIDNNLVGNHLMNMTIPLTHETIKIENNVALVKTVSTLEQMWRDGLENAITYAMKGTDQTVMITLIETNLITQDLSPQPSNNPVIHLVETDSDACYWKNEIIETTVIEPNRLKHGCKPSISFNDSSMTMSYDTVAFDPIIPVYWSNSFIDNYEFSEPQTHDEYRSELLMIPPPKRVYKNSVNISGETTSLNYNIALPNPLDAKVFNIVGNKATRDTFPFLPWIPLKPEVFNVYTSTKSVYPIYKELDIYENGTLDSVSYFVDNEEGSTKLSCYYEKSTGATSFSYSAGFRPYDQSVIPIPEYISTVLDSSYKPNATQYRRAIAVDFWFPQDDPGYLQTGHLKDTNPDDRYGQTLILPIPDAGYTLPSQTRNLYHTPLACQWPSTQTPYETHEPPQIYDQSYEFSIHTPGRVLLNEVTNTVTNQLVEDEGILDDDYWVFYPVHMTASVPSNYTTVVPGLPIRGRWNQNQTFKNATLGPEFETDFALRFYSGCKHLPSFEPDNELVTEETIEINGKIYIRGALIWLFSANTRVGDTYMVSTRSSYRQMIEQTKNGTHHEETYQVIEEKQVSTVEDSILPNIMSSLDETIYLLNGASASMSIGQQEVIQNDLFHIDQTITSTTYMKNKIMEGLANSETESGDLILHANTTNHYLGINTTYGQCITVTYTNDQPTDCEYNTTGVIVAKDYPIEYQITSETNWEIDGSPEITTNSFNTSDMSYADKVGQTIETTETGEIIETAETSSQSYSSYLRQLYLIVNNKPKWVEASAVAINGTTYPIPNIDPFYTVVVDQTIKRKYWLISLDTTTNTNYRISSNVIKYTTTYTDKRTDAAIESTISFNESAYEGNIRLTWEWKNIPTVILSPIQSFVLLLQGMNVTQEIHPINIAQPGASSLNSMIPIVENYYSLATTLRDLHDELVIVKDTFSDAAFYKLDTTSGQERTITLTIKYITKDGRLHQLYIPKNGVFALQLTFGISFYLT